MTATLVLALAWLTTGTATPRTNAPKLTATADVTGDGQPEKLSFEARGATFQLTVGKAQVKAELPGAQGFTLLDLEGSDARREVLVHGEDQGQARYRLYRWEGAALQEVPLPPGTPSASGNGVLLCDVPMKGWRRRDKYLYDAARPGFTEVPQELYAVGKQLQVQRELELWRAPDTLDLVTRVPGGRAFTLLAFQPAPGAARDSEAGGWFLIEKNGEDLIGMASAQAVAEAQQPPSSQPAAETPRPAPRKVSQAMTELIPAGFSLQVARSFPLQFRRDPASAAIAQLREGSTPRLLATDGVWFLLESESGLLGWATAVTLDESLTALEKGKPRDVRASQLLRAQLRLFVRLGILRGMRAVALGGTRLELPLTEVRGPERADGNSLPAEHKSEREDAQSQRHGSSGYTPRLFWPQPVHPALSGAPPRALMADPGQITACRTTRAAGTACRSRCRARTCTPRRRPRAQSPWDCGCNSRAHRPRCGS